jgi:hypothetical protein
MDAAAEVPVIGQTAEMFPELAPVAEALAPPAPPVSGPRKIAKLEVAQDVLASIGLVAGIVIAGISLWAIIRKYRRPAAPPRAQG